MEKKNFFWELENSGVPKKFNTKEEKKQNEIDYLKEKNPETESIHDLIEIVLIVAEWSP